MFKKEVLGKTVRCHKVLQAAHSCDCPSKNQLARGITEESKSLSQLMRRKLLRTNDEVVYDLPSNHIELKLFKAQDVALKKQPP